MVPGRNCEQRTEVQGGESGEHEQQRAKDELRRVAGEQRLFDQAEALEERQARVEERSGEQEQHIRMEEPARRPAPAEERPHRVDQQQPATRLGGEWHSRSRARQEQERHRNGEDDHLHCCKARWLSGHAFYRRRRDARASAATP